MPDTSALSEHAVSQMPPWLSVPKGLDSGICVVSGAPVSAQTVQGNNCGAQTRRERHRSSLGTAGHQQMVVPLTVVRGSDKGHLFPIESHTVTSKLKSPAEKSAATEAEIRPGDDSGVANWLVRRPSSAQHGPTHTAPLLLVPLAPMVLCPHPWGLLPPPHLMTWDTATKGQNGPRAPPCPPPHVPVKGSSGLGSGAALRSAPNQRDF